MKLKNNEILVLRDVKPDMSSHNEFIWPPSGHVEAPDWQDTDKCGNGLHGLPWGVGGNYCISENDGLWLVVKVCTAQGGYQHGTGNMNDKCKFRTGTVVFCGRREQAIALIEKYAPANTPINWSTQTAGYWSTQTAGSESTQTAGNKSTQTAGNWSTQTAGNESTQTAGYWSTQTAGNWSTQTAGSESTQTAGNKSTQTAGNESTQKAGIDSVQIQYWYEDEKYCVATRIVTEKEANKTYRCNNGEWILIEENE